MNSGNFFAELRRRNVYRAAVLYGMGAWLLAQIATQIFPFFNVPNSAVRFVIVALIAGFPIAMVLAWIYELTPEGLVRTEDVDPARRRRFGRKIDFAIIGVLLLVIAMLVYQRLPFRTQSGEPIPAKSIAVLPFENRSEEKANAYFADGIQDEILTRLSKIADLKVISRTSTQHYKSAPENLPQIAKQLGVAHILEGSVQKSGDAVRVNVQLIKAANDSHLWADAYNTIGYWGYVAPKEAFPEAKRAAEKALALDPDSAEAHSARAYTQFQYEWKFKEAEREFKEAIRLNPNSASARLRFAEYLFDFQRIREGHEQ